MRSFTGINQDICARAWDMIQPAIAHGADQGVLNKFAGTIVVLNPHMDLKQFLGSNDPAADVLFMDTLNEEAVDKLKYTTIALAKAAVSAKTGQPSRIVQQEMPHLYQEGDTKWGGSVVRNGLIVSFSGVQAVFDEMVAGWMADAIIALCRHEMTGVMANDSSFL